MTTERQTGKTTAQLKALPKNAIFIWCSNDVHYPNTLLRMMGRSDIRVYPRSVLNDPIPLRGIRYDHIEADHWIHENGMTIREHDTLELLKRRYNH